VGVTGLLGGGGEVRVADGGVRFVGGVEGHRWGNWSGVKDRLSKKKVSKQ